MASFQEIVSCRLIEVRIVNDGFQIALNAADRRFQFMGNVLCQLSFEPGLVILAVLEFCIQVYDVPGNLSELVVGESYVRIPDVLILLRHVREIPQVADVELQFVQIHVEDEQKAERQGKRKEKIVPVGSQHQSHRHVIDVCSPDYQTVVLE